MFKFLAKTFGNKDLRNRILFTLAILLIFRLGASITVPGVTVSGNTFNDNDFFGMINLLGGGALAQFSLFALGVSPYITASIVVQLLSADVVPSLARRAKEGEKGKQELDTITKWLAVIFAAVQGWALSSTMSAQGLIAISGVFSTAFIILILIAGTMVTMWLGDQITKKGIGNGVSLIIFAGIVSSMPYQFQQTFSILVDVSSTSTIFLGMLNFLGFIVLYIGIILMILAVTGATRKLPIQKSGTSTKGDMSYMPMNLNSAGVIPIIFASAIITAPTVIMSGMSDSDTKFFVENLLSLNNNSGFMIYASLIVLFTFFYTNYVSINPETLAKNFHEQGLYIPGVKPGKETYVYVRKTLNRLNVFSATYLILIVALPIYVPRILRINTTLPIGGTSLIIAIGVGLEVYKQIQGRLAQAGYVSGKNKATKVKDKEIIVAEEDKKPTKAKKKEKSKKESKEGDLIW